MASGAVKSSERLSLMERVVAYLKPRASHARPKQDETQKSSLATRLFRESERRLEAVSLDSPHATAREIEMRGVFTNQTVLILAKPSHNITNLQIWLESIFGLNVTLVHDPARYYEWLWRYSGLADLVLIDRDSFTEELPAFGTLLSAADAACDETPVIVMSEDFPVNDFAPNWQDKWDISLKAPVAQTTLWLAIKAAADMALNGKHR